jgi:hypothetical protein
MNTLRVLFHGGLLMMLISMAALAQSVQTDYDRSFNLARLRTYGFNEQERLPGDPLAASPLNDRRIHTALDSQLQAHGFRPSEQPDFLISYFVTTKQGLEIEENRFGITPWDRWGNINVKQVTEGTLMVVFMDPATRQEVWVGFASGTINPKSLDKAVNKSISKLVQLFVKNQGLKKIASQRLDSGPVSLDSDATIHTAQPRAEFVVGPDRFVPSGGPSGGSAEPERKQ